MDCRKACKDWWATLDHYAGDQIRDIEENHANIREIPLCTSVATVHQSESEKNVESSNKVKIKPFQTINLGTDFHVQRYTKKTAEHQRVYHQTRSATLVDDIRRDPGVISCTMQNGFEIYYSKFEQELCAYILKTKQVDIEKLLERSLQVTHSENSVTMLIKLSEGSKEKSTKFWRIVTDACMCFLDEKQYTHYVYSITLGAERVETDASELSKLNLSVGGNAIATEAVGISAKAELTKRNEKQISMVTKRGRIESDSVPTEEVIEVRVKPIFKLIYKESLKVVMQNLLESYNTQKVGEFLLR